MIIKKLKSDEINLLILRFGYLNYPDSTNNLEINGFQEKLTRFIVQGGPRERGSASRNNSSEGFQIREGQLHVCRPQSLRNGF